MKRIAIIGGGPAGLRAAEVVSKGGVDVTLFEGKLSVGRKFLVAGKGGLNLTHSEPLETFVTRYSGPDESVSFWSRVLAEFDNTAIRRWAARLDVGTFAASSGRVYPKALKAAPLLRAWIRRLKSQGVRFEPKHRLLGIVREHDGSLKLSFESENGIKEARFDAVVLALGGGSWPMTGSDGQWIDLMHPHHIHTTPLTAANCGWEVPWSQDVLERSEGEALKNLSVRAGTTEVNGELVITHYGLEGGPIYQLGPAIKALPKPELVIDFKPSFSVSKLVAKMESAKRNFMAEARVRWKLSQPVCSILESFYESFESAEELAVVVKACPIPLVKPRPIEEAISSAGGVAWEEVNDQLMLKKLPGVFCAGEMLDWEAPTGGYLMQGCFATGTLAGKGTLDYLDSDE